MSFWDKPKSVIRVEEIWSWKEKRRLEAAAELKKALHPEWKTDNMAGEWTIPRSKQFSGPAGGGIAGPTSRVTEAVTSSSDELQSLAFLFLFFIPWVLMEGIARESNNYALNDWAYETEAMDCDGNVKAKRVLRPCDSSHPGARHRISLSRTREKWEFTPAFVLSFMAVLIQYGAYGADRPVTIFWKLKRYGIRAPWVTNSITREAFRHARRYIHFVDNNANRDTEDPLYKVAFVTGEITNNLRLGWNLGERICVDESMILYKGRSVKFVQYMPKKPIKHGIKVYCLCDSDTGYLYAFKVYTGKEVGEDGGATTMWSIIEELIRSGCLTEVKGRQCFMDNFYTTTKVIKMLYEKYNWVAAGTIALTNKSVSQRKADDFPFPKLSNAAMGMIDRGWSRRATRDMVQGPSRLQYKMQATIWKDKKPVAWLHTLEVKPNDGGTTKRKVKGNGRALVVTCPPVQRAYAKNFNGVDMNDRDSATYSTSIRSNRWYLRVFFWLLDRVVFSSFIFACSLAKSGLKPGWKKYLTKNDGRFMFQCDLAIALLNHAIYTEWPRNLYRVASKQPHQ